MFGTKDVRFADPIANLYLLTLNDHRVSVLADQQTCSNGKAFVRYNEVLFLLDIDTPTRAVVSYQFDLDGWRVGAANLALDLSDQAGFPDGMVDAGDGTVIIAFYTNSVSPASHGNFYELYAIAAAVVGGCSLRGGQGTVLGIVLGTALLQVLRNLVNLLDVPSSLDFAVMGAVILIGAIADEVFGRRKRRAA